MKKRLGFLSSIVALTVMVSACGSENGAESSKKQDEKKTEAPVELTVAFPVKGAIPKDMQLVNDEINRISKEKINATVKFLPISYSAYVNQVNLMMTSAEKLDLMVEWGPYYSSYVAKGQMLALDDLLSKYGKDVSQSLGPVFLNAPKVKGKLYGVPTIRDLAMDYGFSMRKDLVTKYNIDLSNVKKLDDLESVLKTIKENEPSMAPMTNKTSLYGTFSTRDSLGDDLGVLLNNGQGELKVVNWYETPEYANVVKLMRKWNQAGYAIKDVVTNKESENTIIKAGKAAGNLTHMKPGFAEQQTKIIGTEMIAIKLAPAVVNTSTVNGVMWGIPQGSKNPDKAMQFLNLMYADKDIVNLFNWGIEGKHYVKKQDGFVGYPAGVNENNTGYDLNQGFMFGNSFLADVWEGNDKNIWQEMKKFNESATRSKALGFTYDNTSVKTEVAAVTNVVNQYRLGLEDGAFDPDKELPKFISELKAAGIDKIIAEKQKQLDAWAKENNVK
ncbi:ABC transporter substrate-binding protein [Paenibacillus aceris]|uniref:Aldouronate transport system substrate-binding protein n=1 Tax=Paenibacillus aceris TaxID=869555 RepID=A0ABS4HXV1_9BACL|nr:ABC transporter substrate-binding protein [Paenibacillus aceris]MBP1963036.1 putative aldouronate transport system substrate-binding protein [Paenibacillus aceris]NHW38450.1 ABC transporter substrate-binding protein [Paenibacillus aceris]